MSIAVKQSLQGDISSGKVFKGTLNSGSVIQGVDGVTFVPNLDENGNLSETNRWYRSSYLKTQYIYDENGKKHIFGFEITWAIGDESNATETCLFYDGKAHKFGAVDVETFPKDDKYMEPWKFISEDGRFNLTMTPFYDLHSDLDLKIGRMHSHQVHGLWNGDVTLDDGTKLEIKNMYAFCEYVENRW